MLNFLSAKHDAVPADVLAEALPTFELYLARMVPGLDEARYFHGWLERGLAPQDVPTAVILNGLFDPYTRRAEPTMLCGLGPALGEARAAAGVSLDDATAVIHPVLRNDELLCWEEGQFFREPKRCHAGRGHVQARTIAEYIFRLHQTLAYGQPFPSRQRRLYGRTRDWRGERLEAKDFHEAVKRLEAETVPIVEALRERTGLSVHAIKAWRYRTGVPPRYGMLVRDVLADPPAPEVSPEIRADIAASGAIVDGLPARWVRSRGSGGKFAKL